MRPFKLLSAVIAVLSISILTGRAQNAGEVMFVGLNADGNDGFAFVALVDIPANTTIFFTDNEWDGVSAFTAGEGFNSWSHTSIVPAGTVVTITNLDNTPAITATIGTAIVDGGTAMGIRDQNEVVYMYLGTDRTTPTTFLSAISNENFTTSGTLTATGLSIGVNAIEFTGDEDVMVYLNNTNCNSTPANCAASIANTSNWDTEDGVGDQSANAVFPDFPANVCDVAGTLFYPQTTYYSLATGIWDVNTSWSLTSDGSSGAVPVGEWPRRTDNVVIRSGHTITVNAVDDNKSCGNSPNGLNRSNVSAFTGSADLMFYHTGDVIISSGGTLTDSEEIMLEGYTLVEDGGTFNITEDIINLGYLEVSATATFNNTDDLILSGNSITIIDNTSTGFDDIYIDWTDATLCGEGAMSIGNGGADPEIQYFNGATNAQICSSFTVTCSINCGVAPFDGTVTGGFSSGNSGPGGVGSTTGSGDVRLWLDANTINQADATNVTTWSDQSGYGNDAAAPGGNEPVFNTNQLNGFPALQFTVGNTDYLRVTDDASLNPATVSLFCVGNITSASSANSGLITKVQSITSPYNGYAIAKNAATLRSLFAINDAAHLLPSSATYTSGEYVVFEATHDQTTMELFHNENNVGSLAQAAAITTNTNFLYLGILPDAVGTGIVAPLDGDIAEAVVMGRNVNDAERILVANYLSAKYAIAIANDVYTMDNGGNGDYDFEVAGIGQAADGSNHRDARGTGVVRMWNPNNLANSEFLMWGHDNTAITSTIIAPGDVDGTIIQERLSRIWRAGETGDVGNVSISFDFNPVGGSPLGSNLRLLIDRDGDGFADNDVTPIVGSVSGNIAVFSNVNFQDGDRFTLGNTDASIPLPIELVSFDAVPHGTLVVVNWTTESELNNDFFTVEKSADAEQWQTIIQVPGAGTSHKVNQYQVQDDQPIPGISYYRLKQTDFDGQFAYSPIVSVNFTGHEALIVSPNPSDGIFTVVGNHLSPDQIRVYNSLGKQIQVSTSISGPDTELNISALPGGIYVLQVSDGASLKSIRLLKK